ncbi:MAG: hypothetical protein COA79_08565 [Planctomycetota bacterium]|nr:MAG: hypothetical protein COA79_08565 [Planctomycetota bacterium]
MKTNQVNVNGEMVFENDDAFFEEEIEKKHSNSKASAWLISLLVHSFILGSLFYMLMPSQEKEVVITTTPIPQHEEEKEEEKEIEVLKEKVAIEAEIVIDTTPIVTEEVVDDVMETENEMESESAEGVSEAISDMPLVGSGVMGNIGGGGGGGGAFGNRSGGGRKKAVMKNGGSKKTESAVDLGLWWLANHQEADGHWDLDKYEGKNTLENTPGCTAAALLAFLGAGHTDKVGKFKKNVKNAIQWLLKAQKKDGSFGKFNYAQGLCTMALAEALGMGCGTVYKEEKAVELAVDYLIAQQNPSGAYNYKQSSKRDDMSVTGWCVMGLKSAMIAGIREKQIKTVFDGVVKNLDNNLTTTGDNTSSTRGRSWYMGGGGQKAGTACGAIAMLIRQYTGWHRTEPWLEAATEGHVQSIPVKYENMNVYRVYYAYLTLFQQGGKAWRTWNKPVSDLIVKTQRQDGDFKGSWNPNAVSHMEGGGRVLFTAFLVLSLEVFYRYESVSRH